eukprot:6479765-Amphidinium_carterae.1
MRMAIPMIQKNKMRQPPTLKVNTFKPPYQHSLWIRQLYLSHTTLLQPSTVINTSNSEVH